MQSRAEPGYEIGLNFREISHQAWVFLQSNDNPYALFKGSNQIHSPTTAKLTPRILTSVPAKPTGFLVVWTLCFMTLSSLAGQEEEAYEKVIRPILKQHCLACHSGDDAEGGIDLSSKTLNAFDEEGVETWSNILGVIVSQEMPPEDEPQLSPKHKTRITGWIKSQLKQKGHSSEWERKMLYPEYGNLVDHQQLFYPAIETIAWSPSRLWKRSPNIFDSMVVRGMGFGQGRYGRPHPKLAKVKQPFTIEDKTGVKDYAAITFADSATLGTMLRNSETIVDQLLGGAFHQKHVQVHGETPDDQLPKDKRGRPIRPRYHKTPKEFSGIILSEDVPNDKAIDAAIVKMYELVVDRAAVQQDIEKYRRLMKSWIKNGDKDEALRMVLIAIAISPEAIYRSELGVGPKDVHGRQMLAPVDLAYAIAYALTDEKPDDLLLRAAKEGRLKTKEDVAREVTRIWDDPEIDKPRILRFFHEYFGYHAAPKVFKDTPRFGKDYRNVPEKLVQDADTLVLHIVNQDKNVLAELLTTEKYFVGHSGDNDKERKTNEAINKFYEYFKDKPWKEFPYQTPKEHAAYARSIDRMFAHPNGNVVKGWMKYLTMCDKNGITPMPTQRQHDFLIAYNLDKRTFNWPIEQPFALAPGKRIGILMHPAWLIAHSLNLDNDPVRRGKWIRERLLADTVPELPITVDAQLPDAPEQSLRERFAVTREEACWRCHVKMNPLGMPFERFDDFGRHRTKEKLLAPRKTKPVNSTGFLKGTRDEKLDGPVENPVEMMKRLAKSERVRQSFVRHAFRYWMGRNEMITDASTLVTAEQAYVDNEGSFRAMVISLLTSDSFLYRKNEIEIEK